jgi:hypothetical protein
MSTPIAATISAFAHRGVRRRHALELLAYSGGIVALLLLFAAWICAQGREAPPPYYWDASIKVPPIPWNELGLADLFSVYLLGMAAFVIIPAQVAAVVASERRGGTLDQLRTTPIEPLGLLAGLLFGVPARLYLLCAAPVALHVLCGLTGVIHFETMIATLVTLGTGGLFCTVLASVVALAPRQDSGGTFVALAVAAFLCGSGILTMVLVSERSGIHWAFMHPAGALQAELISHDGLWRSLLTDWWNRERFAEPSYSGQLSLQPVLAALLSVTAGAVLARGACRRLAAPHLPLLSKPQALALFGLGAASLILPLPMTDYYSHSMASTVPLVFGLLLLPVAALLGLLATPTVEAWLMGLRDKRVRPFSDDATPHTTVWAMLGLFLALVAVRMGGHGFPELLHGRDWTALAWGCALAATVPIYLLFASTRYATAGARVAFCAGISAFLLMQAIAVGCTLGGVRDGAETSFVEFAAVLGLAVPIWVGWRQRVLRSKLLAA